MVVKKTSTVRSVDLEDMFVCRGTKMFLFDVSDFLMKLTFVNLGDYHQTNKPPPGVGQRGVFRDFEHTKFVVAKFINEGQFTFNYLESFKVPTFAIYGTAFSNLAHMWIGLGGEARDDEVVSSEDHFQIPDIEIETTDLFENKGRILFLGIPVIQAVVRLGCDAAGRNEIVNEGSLCFAQSIYDQTSNIKGSGCIVIGSDSEVTLNDEFALDSRHMIYMQPGKSTAMLNLKFSDKPGEIHIKIGGFSKKSYIKFSSPVEHLVFIDGVLKLRRPGKDFSHFLHLGSGYKKDLFRFNENGITYDGNVIQSMPSACLCNWVFGMVVV